MWPYWVMFLLPAWAALSAPNLNIATANLRGKRVDFAWASFWLFITTLIGFRYQVGGDWGAYLRMLSETDGLDIEQILTASDPGYGLLNRLSLEMDWGIYGVNVIGGAIFAFGLMVFCRSGSRPWLALAVSIPYLVIVVAMGYTRQGIALGLVMVGLVALRNNSVVWFVAWVALGATFHKSAVLLFPIAALSTTRKRYWTAAWVAVFGGTLYKVLLETDAESLYENYVVAQYQSEGALVRLLMNTLPAVLFLMWRQRFQFAESEERLWTWISIISLAMLGLYAASPASTAIDRVALYMLPLQLAVFSRLPDALGAKVKRPVSVRRKPVPSWSATDPLAASASMGATAEGSTAGRMAGSMAMDPTAPAPMATTAAPTVTGGMAAGRGPAGIAGAPAARLRPGQRSAYSPLARYRALTTAGVSAPPGGYSPFTPESGRQLTAAVLLYYAVVLFVWLNYAANASYWLPYRLYFLAS